MKPSPTQKKIIIMTGMLCLMGAKILLAVHFLHRWKMQAIAEGRPLGDAEDRANS